MTRNHLSRAVLLGSFSLVIVVVLSISIFSTDFVPVANSSYPPPGSTPTTSPTPNAYPYPLSQSISPTTVSPVQPLAAVLPVLPEDQIVLKSVSGKANLSTDELVIINRQPRSYPNLGKNFLDLKDGAGGIVADIAELSARITGSIPPSQSNKCNGPCWWAEFVNSNSFDANGYRYYYFSARKGDIIRAAISWSSVINCTVPGQGDCVYPYLHNDLDMSIQQLQGSVWNFLSNSLSGTYDNNYELVPQDGKITIPATGIYRIAVQKRTFSNTEAIWLGVTWARINPYISLPMITR